MAITIITPKDYTNADVDNIVTGNAVNVFSFLPSNVQADILAGTQTADVSSYLNDAHQEAGIGGRVYYPPGTYPCSNVGYLDAQSVVGAGPTSTILTKAGLLGSEGNCILAPYNYLNDIQLQHRGGNLIRDLGFAVDATATGGYCIVDFANRGRIENNTIVTKPLGPMGGIRLATNTISGLPITNNNNIAGTHLFNNAINGCSLGGIIAVGTYITAISVNVSITLSQNTLAPGTAANTYTDSNTGVTFTGTSNGTNVILVANTTGLAAGHRITGSDVIFDQATDLYMSKNIVQNCGSIEGHGFVASVDSPSMSGWIMIQNKLEHSPGPLVRCVKSQSLLILGNLFDWQCNIPDAASNICLQIIGSNSQGRNIVSNNQFKGSNFFDVSKPATFIDWSPGFPHDGMTFCAPNECSGNTFNFAANPTGGLLCININQPKDILGVATDNSYDNKITDAQRGNGDAQWAPRTTQVQVQKALTAHAGGGQGSAVALQWGFNEVQVCATNGDSVLLPPALGTGGSVEVGNDGAATCAVFPSTGDAINRGSANASVNVASGSGAKYRDFAAGLWRSFP